MADLTPTPPIDRIAYALLFSIELAIVTPLMFIALAFAAPNVFAGFVAMMIAFFVLAYIPEHSSNILPLSHTAETRDYSFPGGIGLVIAINMIVYFNSGQQPMYVLAIVEQSVLYLGWGGYLLKLFFDDKSAIQAESNRLDREAQEQEALAIRADEQRQQRMHDAEIARQATERENAERLARDRHVQFAALRRAMTELVVANAKELKWAGWNADAVHAEFDEWEQLYRAEWDRFEMDHEHLRTLIHIQAAIGRVQHVYETVQPQIQDTISKAVVNRLLADIQDRTIDRFLTIDQGKQDCIRVLEMIENASKDAYPEWEVTEERKQIDHLRERLSEPDDDDQHPDSFTSDDVMNDTANVLPLKSRDREVGSG